MQLSALQIVLLVLVAAEINVDRRGLSLTHARPVIVGFLCGLILGDMNSGLYIGGTFTLMSLGVAALGGSSVPDYGVATIIACAFAKTTGQGPEGKFVERKGRLRSSRGTLILFYSPLGGLPILAPRRWIRFLYFR